MIFGACCKTTSTERDFEMTQYEAPAPEFEEPYPYLTDYYARIITKDAHDEIIRSETGEIDDVYFIHMQDRDNPRHPLLSLAVDLHDSFALLRQYLESWRLPCVVAYHENVNALTGIELLALGSPATINWIGHMITDGGVMTEFLKFGGLTFTNDSLCAVVTPRHLLPTDAPPNSPRVRRRPRTQLTVSPPSSAPPRIRHLPPTPAEDSDSESEASEERIQEALVTVHTDPIEWRL